MRLDMTIDPRETLPLFEKAVLKIQRAERAGLKVPLALRCLLGSIVEIGKTIEVPVEALSLMAQGASIAIACMPQEWRERADELAPQGTAPDELPNDFE